MTYDSKTISYENRVLKSFFEKQILKERRKKNWARLIRDLLITSAAIYLLFGKIFGVAVIRGDSMAPNLTSGSVTLFYRLDHIYKKNDIVIFQPPGKNDFLVKRIVAVAGDKVDINDETGELLVNGIVQTSDAVNGKTFTRENGSAFPLTVPNHCVFVLGDNREAALDSRNLGTIETENLVGRMLFEIKNLESS